MRNTFKVTFALTLAAVMAMPAFAQRQRPGGFGGFGAAGLLSNKSVQEELKITEDQTKKITDLSAKSRTLYEEKTKDVPRDQREKREEIRREVSAEIAKEINGVLSSEQQKRYKQIQLQTQGTRAFSSEEVQKALNLTDAQKESIKTVVEGQRDAIRKATEGLNFRTDAEKFREATQKVRQETEGKIAATLTADQKKIWKEMIGEKFEIKFEAPRPGQGGFQRPGTTPRPGGNRPARPEGAPQRPPARVDL